LVRFQRHHDKVLKAMLPKLKKHLDKHGVDVGLYTLKWFFQCFLDRVPFELALRLWDLFVMDGDRVLICGAYTILKLHQKELLARKNMDDLLDYIQSKIPSDLSRENDKVIELYQRCSEELHRKKLDTGGDPGEDELPKRPFGLIENIIKPVPVRKETPDRRLIKETTETIESEAGDARFDEEEDFDDISEKASASRVTVTSAASSSHHSPHNFSRPLSSVSNFSYASAIEEYNNPSNKSTPLKMNGVNSSTKHKNVTGHGDVKSSQLASATGMNHAKIEEAATGNGRVEAIESTEESLTLVDNHSSLPVVENVKETEVIEHLIGSSSRTVVDGSSSLRKERAHHSSPEKTSSLRNSKPPPPPPRSPVEPSYVVGGGFSGVSSVVGVSQITFPVTSTTITSSMLETTHRVKDAESNIILMKSEEVSSKKYSTPHSPHRITLSSGTGSEVVLPSDSNGPSSLTRNIPGGETVRIHVPYSNSTASDISTAPTVSSTTSRTNLNTLKNDPNRIKIDISSK
jgi:hypothetical protein